MLELSDIIERKFTQSWDVDDWEIETDTGWEDISTVYETILYQKYILTLESGKFLECADTHIIFDENFNEIFVKDCIPGQTKIITEDGIELVESIEITDDFENMYDIEVNSENHRFYSNEILSHNTTSLTAMMIWYILFHKNYVIAILAHKLDQAKEILSRMTYAYEFIPKWLQQGIVEWNKLNITLENGSKIIVSATTASAIRGQSVNMVYLDEFAFVQTNVAEKFFTSVYPTISSGKTTKVVITSTPQGLNYFYKIWVNSELGRNDYHRIEINWWDTPGRDEKWKEETIRGMNGDEQKFAEEYGCIFGDSLVTVRDKKTKKIYRVSIEHLYDFLI